MESTQPTGSRWRNIFAALGVLAYMIASSIIAAIVLVLLLAIIQVALGSASSIAGVIDALDGDPNLLSISVYVLMGVPVALLLHAHLHPRLRARDLKPVWDSDYERMAHEGDAANQPVAMPASEAIGSARPTHVMADTAAPVAALPRVSLSLAGFTLRSLALIVLLVIGVQYLTDLVFVLYDQFAPSVIEEYTDLLEGSGLTSYGVLWFIATIVLPPLVEEAGFRGLALTYFRRAGAPFAVANIIQALAFGIFHMNLLQGTYTFFAGLVLGFVAYRYHSLVPAIIMHALYNLWGTFGSEMMNALLPNLSIVVSITFGAVVTVVALVLIVRDTAGAASPHDA